MKGRRIGRVLACILLLATIVGCHQPSNYPEELPMPELTPPPMGVGEARAIQATLYFLAENGRTLVPEQRSLRVQPGESAAHAAVAALVSGPTTGGASVVPETLALEGVELSGDICNIYFTGALDEDSGSLLTLRAALAATVCEVQGCAYVDVFINRMQPGYNGRPLGAMAPINITLEAYIANMQQEYADTPVAVSEADVLESRFAALYFSDVAGELLLCDVRAVLYGREADGPLMVSALLIELMKGPLNSEGREWLLPSDMRLKKAEFVPVTAKSGAAESPAPEQDAEEEAAQSPGARAQASGGPYVLELYFDKPLFFEKEAMTYASLVYTVTGFFPDVAGVRIYLDGELAHAESLLDSREGGIAGQPEAFVRADFFPRLGQLVRLCFPDKNGQGLHTVWRSMRQEDAYDPGTRLSELFLGAADPGVRIDAFSPEDILSVSREGNMMVVNFRAGFLDKLKQFLKGAGTLPAHTRARMFVFSVVNTLCAMQGTARVWLLEDGARIDETVDMIYLGGPLFENPGLILQ